MKILSNLIAVAVIAALAVSFSSCKKDCYECTDGVDFTEYCEDGLGSKVAVDLAVASYEASGGVCTKK